MWKTINNLCLKNLELLLDIVSIYGKLQIESAEIMHHSSIFGLYDSDVARVEPFGDKRRLILIERYEKGI